MEHHINAFQTEAANFELTFRDLIQVSSNPETRNFYRERGSGSMAAPMVEGRGKSSGQI
jgi:hypothetical protein